VPDGLFDLQTKEALKRDKDRYERHLAKLQVQLENTVNDYEQRFAEFEEEKTKRSKETISGTHSLLVAHF
jgi:hypothetical protein